MVEEESLGGYRVGRYFRQRKEFGQTYGKNSIQFVIKRNTRVVRMEMGCFGQQMTWWGVEGR